MNKIDDILRKLKSDGCRITSLRKNILIFMLDNKIPLSSLDVQKHFLKNNIPANKTTIYRELEFLNKKNIISEIIFLDGIKRYEIILKHHHHIVCVNCNKIEDVVLKKDLADQEKIITKSKKFKIINHSLEFFGICKKCQKTTQQS
jgi:Fur family ferric uptake transcriptional regulator